MKYQRFVVISSPRSGTHMLRTALNNHPQVHAFSEAFNPDYLHDADYDALTDEDTILQEHIFTNHHEDIRQVGFMLHRSGAKFSHWPSLWQRLREDTELNVIMLHRHNLLERYLSFKKMRARIQKKPFTPLMLSVEELRQEFIRYENELADFKQQFSNHRQCQISYEQLCFKKEETLQRLQLFLNLDVTAISPNTPKNSAHNFQEDIVNFSDLSKAFSDSRWAWCFHLPESVKASTTFSFDFIH